MKLFWMMLLPLLVTVTSCSSAPTASEKPLTVDDIRQVLLLNVPKFRACYEETVSVDGKTNRAVELQFTIGPKGRVTKAKTILLSGTKIPARLEKCLNNVLFSAEFLKPENGGTIDVRQPMNFFPQD